MQAVDLEVRYLRLTDSMSFVLNLVVTYDSTNACVHAELPPNLHPVT